MIEGAKWRRWVFFCIPLAVFVFVLLFPFYWMLVTSFRPDNELYRPWMAPNYTPFWTLHPTLDHVRYLLGETLFSTWMLNTLIISIVATVISLFCGLLAGYALSRLNFPFAGSLGTGIFITYLVPQTLLFIPLADIVRNFRLGDTPWALILTYPTFLIPFCTWLMMGYFQGHPEGAGGVRAHRRRLPPEGDAAHHPADRGAGHPLGRHLRLHALLERVRLRPRLPLLAGAEDRSRRCHLGADPRRRLLLGAADGGRAARLHPGGAGLFLLCGAL